MPPSWSVRRSFRRPLHSQPLEFHGLLPVARWIGVRFELTVLLLTEIVSTVYYRLLHRHGQDTALRAMCRLIIRDEVGHVAFHRDRLARAARAGTRSHGKCWELCFRTLGFTAATMLWINHAPGVTARGCEYRRVLPRGVAGVIALCSPAAS